MMLTLLSAGSFAEAASFRQGVSAYNRQDYVLASRIFIPFAEQGQPAAQTYLGYMFETGRGVPQNYTEAAMWYRRAAEQGDSQAQYSLGLLYARGQGVPRDIVEASKWLNLATAAAPPRAREARVKARPHAITGSGTKCLSGSKPGRPSTRMSYSPEYGAGGKPHFARNASQFAYISAR